MNIVKFKFNLSEIFNKSIYQSLKINLVIIKMLFHSKILNVIF